MALGLLLIMLSDMIFENVKFAFCFVVATLIAYWVIAFTTPVHSICADCTYEKIDETHTFTKDRKAIIIAETYQLSHNCPNAKGERYPYFNEQNSYTTYRIVKYDKN